MPPSQLGDYDVIIAAPEGLSNQKTLQVWGVFTLSCVCGGGPS